MSDKIQQLINEAFDRVNKMTDSQKLRMWYEQRRSFAKGMCPDNRDYAIHCSMIDRLQPPEDVLSDAEIGLVLLGQYHAK